MENRSGLGQAQDQAKIAAEEVNPTYSIRRGGWVAKPTTFAASSRVMGWSTCNLFYSLICIIPRVLITNANRVCIAQIFEKYLPVVCKRLDRLNDERRVKITLRDRELLTHSYPVTFLSPTAKSIPLTN